MTKDSLEIWKKSVNFGTDLIFSKMFCCCFSLFCFLAAVTNVNYGERGSQFQVIVDHSRDTSVAGN